MVTLKDSFTKGITAINVKTNNFMEQSKCKTYITTLENEIKELKMQAGELFYTNWSNGETSNENIEGIASEIAKKYEEIKGQQDKIQQLIIEEQQILGTQQMAQGNIGLYCSQCGMKNEAHYRFCCRCGAPLRQ